MAFHRKFVASNCGTPAYSARKRNPFTRQSSDRRRKMKHVLWVLFCIFCITTICTAQSVLYFPQIVDGQAGGFVWGSGIILTNTAAPGTAVAIGTLTLTKDDGTAWSLPLTDL